MSFDDVYAKLSKKTKDRLKLASEITTEFIPTASIGLNRDLKGGFGRGRQTVIWGNKSAGKSSMVLQTIAEAQKRGDICAWIDAENTFDKTWAARLGVNCDELIVTKSRSIDEAVADISDFLEAEVDIIVLDSINALLPSTYFEKKDELKEGLEGTKQIGTVSKELAVAVNKFNYLNKRSALVLISQLRNKIGGYGAMADMAGGEAMKFFSSTVIKLWSSASEKEQKQGEVQLGDKLIKKPIGRPVNYTVQFNKLGPPNQTGTYDFYYDGAVVGIDQVGEIVDMAESLGLIDKSGAWYYYEEEKFQGRTKVVDYFKENDAERGVLEKRVLNEH
jgi:recombination protein RecA